jgi:hypothetical protein
MPLHKPPQALSIWTFLVEMKCISRRYCSSSICCVSGIVLTILYSLNPQDKWLDSIIPILELKKLRLFFTQRQVIRKEHIQDSAVSDPEPML